MVAHPHDDRHVEAFLAECVHESLNNYMISNAVFLGERLNAACPNEVRPPDPPLTGPLGTPPSAPAPLTPHPSDCHPQTNAHLLATCYYRDDKAYRAYHLLRGTTSPRCRYLLARCCYDLKKHAEAEAALVSPDASKPFPLDPNPGHPVGDVPNGAAGQYLLGLVCKETGRRAAAVAHLAAALAADPFMCARTSNSARSAPRRRRGKSCARPRPPPTSRALRQTRGGCGGGLRGGVRRDGRDGTPGPGRARTRRREVDARADGDTRGGVARAGHRATCPPLFAEGDRPSRRNRRRGGRETRDARGRARSRARSSASAASRFPPAQGHPHRPSGRRRNLRADTRRRGGESGCPRRRPWAPRLRIPAAGV